MTHRANASNFTRLMLILVGLLCGTGGCSTLRSVEQWKCDHWGMCHFGTTPTPTASAPDCPTP
jgi:hypothetical protein